MAKAITDIFSNRLGWITLVFDNLSNAEDGDALLATLFKQVYAPAQYLYFKPPFLYAEVSACDNLFAKLQQGLRNKTLEKADGKYMFVFYEDMQRFSAARLEELLSFYDIARKNLNHQDKSIEAHLFCVMKETINSKEQKSAYERMCQITENLINESESIKLRLYLVVCPIISDIYSYMEATVRWVYLCSRDERRSEIFSMLYPDALFCNITYAGYHVEGCKDARRQIAEITSRLGDGSFDKVQLKRLAEKNFENITARGLNNINFDVAAFIQGFPILKDAVGNLFTFLFKRSALYNALARLDDAIRDTYMHGVHIPMVLNARKNIYGNGEIDLIKAVFDGAPPDSIVKWGAEVANELWSDIEAKAHKNAQSGFLRPTLGRVKLIEKIVVFLSYLLEESKNQLPVILAGDLLESLPDRIAYFKQEEKENKERLSVLRHQLTMMGGEYFADESTFILQARQAVSGSVSIHFEKYRKECNFLLVSQTVRQEWNHYSDEIADDDYHYVYCLSDSNYNVLQAFRVIVFENVDKQMFRLED